MDPRLQELLMRRARNGTLPQAAAAAAAEEVYLYEAIGGWFGSPASETVAALKATTAQTVNLRVNCPGGDVFDARSIVAAIHDIRRAGRNVIARVDGLAASAASWIAIACSEVQMQEGSFMMIHNTWTIEMGDAAQLEQTAGLLRKLDATYRSDYAKKSGKTDAAITELMDAETWFEAQEAVDQGFADKVVNAEGEDAGAAQAPAEDAARARILALFKKAPAALNKRPAQPAAAAVADLDREILEANARRMQMLERLAP